MQNYRMTFSARLLNYHFEANIQNEEAVVNSCRWKSLYVSLDLTKTGDQRR